MYMDMGLRNLKEEKESDVSEKSGYTIEQYSKDAARTFLSTDDHEKDILHCLMGLQTEVGELCDAYKKHFFYGKELDITNVSEELADTLWYMTNLARLEKVDFVQSMKNNIAKLKVRFPNKFTTENALERNLDSEREALEQE